MRTADALSVGNPAAPSAPAALPVAPIPAAYDAYDPFHLAEADEDDVPFDAPSEADLDDLIDAEECLLLERRSEATPPPPAPAQPTIVKAPLELAPIRPIVAALPRDRGYLYAARQAARNADGRRGGSLSPSALRVASNFAALIVLIGAGAGAALSRVQEGAPPPVPGPAAAAAAAPVDPLAEYRRAVALMEQGRRDEGLEALRIAADAGLAPAQYRLAKAYENGEGVERDLARARELTEQAAEAGNCRAMHDAGVFLARGEGAPRDEAGAARWFRAAAERGVADSQYNLGLLHQQGRGVAQSPSDALYWFLLAARQDDLNAVERAVEVATQLTPEDVAQARARARAFRVQPSDASANGVAEGAASFSCASV